jgi:tungstate transport system permease protein
MYGALASTGWAEITGRTLLVSGLAVAVAVALGIPLGAALGTSRFRARSLVLAIVNTGMGLPPVLVGLVVALALFRSGPLGFLSWIYTVQAMVASQAIIALPLVVGLTAAGVQQLDPQLALQLRSLGASRAQLTFLLLKEARLSVLAAIMAGFGGAISEVGAVMMVGGNIRGQTQVLTTAIVQSTRMGDFGAAVILGIVLLAIAFAVNLALTRLQQKGQGR